MNDDESRPLTDAQSAAYWEAIAREYHTSLRQTTGVLELMSAKAAAMDRTLASWGMTGDEYQRKGEANG